MTFASFVENLTKVGTYDIVILFGLDGIMPNAVQYGMRRI
jgi:hypothetical protein